MRFNDGEQLQLNSEVNGPLARYTDTFIRLSFSVQARCPGLCVGIIHPDDNSTLAALGQTHLDWWQTSGLPNTRALFRSGLLPDQSYCFGMVNYRPKDGPEAMTLAEFQAQWEEVFANKTVLIVAALDYLFIRRCGGCRQISSLLLGHGAKVPPYSRSREVLALNPDLVGFEPPLGSAWSGVVKATLAAVAQAQADVVAVSWGTSADLLVAELACRGTQAIDVGNLGSILEGGSTAQSVDPDEFERAS